MLAWSQNTGRVEKAVLARKLGAASRAAKYGKRAAEYPAQCSVFDEIPTAMLCLDEHGHIRYANRAACNFLNWREGVRWVQYGSMLCPEEKEALVCAIHDALLWGQATDVYQNLHLGHRKRRASVHIGPMGGAHKGLLCVTLHRVPCSETKIVRRMQATMSHISHDLRTHLHMLLGMAQLMETDPLTKEMRTYRVDQFRRNGRAALRLLNNIVDATRLEGGKLVMNARRHAVTPLLREVVQGAQTYSEMRSLQLKLILFDEALFIRCDASMLQRVLMNLLSNAMKFSSPGKQVIMRLTKSELPTGTHATISVEDEGCGIAEDRMPRLFERYQPRTGLPGEGSGLGLYLAKHLTQLLEGQIEVRSQVGVGSIFSVHFPLADPPLTAEEPPVVVDLSTYISRMQIEMSAVEVMG